MPIISTNINSRRGNRAGGLNDQLKTTKNRLIVIGSCLGFALVCVINARDGISSRALPNDLDSSLLNVYGSPGGDTISSANRVLSNANTDAINSQSQAVKLITSKETTPSVRSASSPSSSQQQQQQQQQQKQRSTNNSNIKNEDGDWKLWHDMTKEEQDASVSRLKPYVEKYGQLYMKGYGIGNKKHKHGRCDLVTLQDKRAAGHSLCGPPPPQPCNFFSFGINDDPSFDVTVAGQWGCRGFAADPTVDHPSKLHPLVTFHNIGLKTLEANEERLINKGGKADWWMMSIPGIYKALGLDHLDILKIDCEGCEVALARDILMEDRYFLHKVNQISLETHTSRSWINSTEAAYYFGLLFPLMEEAGFQLEWSHRCGCSKRHEITGCHPSIIEMGFPCGYDPWPDRPNVVLGRSCQDALYYRYPEKATVISSVS